MFLGYTRAALREGLAHLKRFWGRFERVGKASGEGFNRFQQTSHYRETQTDLLVLQKAPTKTVHNKVLKVPPVMISAQDSCVIFSWVANAAHFEWILSWFDPHHSSVEVLPNSSWKQILNMLITATSKSLLQGHAGDEFGACSSPRFADVRNLQPIVSTVEVRLRAFAWSYIDCDRITCSATSPGMVYFLPCSRGLGEARG